MAATTRPRTAGIASRSRRAVRRRARLSVRDRPRRRRARADRLCRSSAGFVPPVRIAAKPVGLPHPWVIHNYAQVITSGAFWRQVGNSTIVAAIATALVVGVSALAAYPLSRLQFRGREAIYTFFTFGLLFPVAVAALPLYLLLRQLGLASSRSSVSRSRRRHSGFRSRSSSCGRSWKHPCRARGRGCHGRLRKIRLLLARSAAAVAVGAVTVIVLSVVTSWNNYILPARAQRPEPLTPPLGVASYNGSTVRTPRGSSPSPHFRYCRR